MTTSESVFVASDSKVTIDSPPKVLVVDAIDIVRNGEHFAADATYDFSRIPPELHATALSLIGKRVQLFVGPWMTDAERVQARRALEELEARSNRPWWRFW